MSRLTGWSDSDIGEVRISTIWALGASGDPRVAARLQPFYQSPDPGIRKMVVYALGALPGDAQLGTLRTALQDAEPDVRWNAAVALARHGDREGAGVIRQMLDRGYVEQTVKREVRQDGDMDPIADVMISGLRAAAALKDDTLREPIAALSQQDRSMKVRQAAFEALKAIVVRKRMADESEVHQGAIPDGAADRGSSRAAAGAGGAAAQAGGARVRRPRRYPISPAGPRPWRPRVAPPRRRRPLRRPPRRLGGPRLPTTRRRC